MLNIKPILNDLRDLAVAGVIFALAILGTVQAATPEQAVNLVKSTTYQMLKTLQDRREEINAKPALIYGLAEEIAVPYFDFERITQYAVGRFWRDASVEQRQELVTEFRTLLIHTYAKALLNYSGQKIRILPMRASSSAERVQVNTEVDMGESPVPINYLMYLNNDSWKVYDVVIDGVSLVTNYRGNFAEEVRRGGIARLIQALKTRNQANHS